MQDVFAVQCPNAEEELYEPKCNQFFIQNLSILLERLQETRQITCLAALHNDDELILYPEELLIFDDEWDFGRVDFFIDFFEDFDLHGCDGTSPKADLTSSSESPSRNIFLATK